MIGLVKAIRDYKPDKRTGFRAFAELCITRQILTAIKTATRKKHQPLNTYISLNRPAFEPEEDKTLLDMVASVEVMDPEALLISRENFQAMTRDIDQRLSKLEKQALELYLRGLSYQQIGEILHKSPKSIDNAIQRVKKKLEQYGSDR